MIVNIILLREHFTPMRSVRTLFLCGLLLICWVSPVIVFAQTQDELLKKRASGYLLLSDELIATNPKEAEEYLQKAFPLLEKLENYPFWGTYYKNLGRVQINRNEFMEALGSYLTGLRYFQVAKIPTQIAFSYALLGDLHVAMNNSVKSLEYYQKALSTMKGVSPTHEIRKQVDYLCTIGGIKSQLNQSLLATKDLNEARRLAQQNAYQYGEGLALLLLGRNKVVQKKMDEAADLLVLALGTQERYKITELQAQTLNELSLIGLNNDQVDLGLQHNNRALNLASKNLQTRSATYRTRAKLMLYKGALDSATYYCQMALQILPPKKWSKERQELIEFKGSVFERKGDLSNALMHYEWSKALTDSALTDPLRQAFERKQLEYTMIMTQEKTRARYDAELSTERQGRAITILFSSLILIVGAAFFGLSLFRQRINRKLRVQNKEIEEQKDQLLKLNQVKDHLFSIISHDLRSPLKAILAVLENLNDPDTQSSERLRWFNLLRQQTARTSSLLENLLYWAQIQMNRYDRIYEPVHLYPLVKDLIESVQLFAPDKPVNFHLDINPDLIFYSDANMLKMALRNLMVNALKFSSAGQSIFIHAAQDEKETIIEIKDEGIGMTQDEMEKAMQGRLPRKGTLGESGSGIGLSLVRQSIENQGGTLKGFSELQKGCTFIVSIPNVKNNKQKQDLELDPRNLATQNQ
jgi:signal transduction histidine kinase